MKQIGQIVFNLTDDEKIITSSVFDDVLLRNIINAMADLENILTTAAAEIALYKNLTPEQAAQEISVNEVMKHIEHSIEINKILK